MSQLPAIPAEIARLLPECSAEERYALFRFLRREFPLHDLEARLNTSAEVILEAISRASDLTLRGIRGIIAEAAFKQEIILPFTSTAATWSEVELIGDHPFDFALEDRLGRVTIQVKMQRQKAQRPMLASEANKAMFRGLDDFYVVETQRTRGGKNNNGGDTRPYRFGEFDLLAVAMHPSTGDWSRFLYTVERWLLPTRGAEDQVFKYQPVPKAQDEFWTDDLEVAIEWLRSGESKRLPCTAPSLFS